MKEQELIELRKKLRITEIHNRQEKSAIYYKELEEKMKTLVGKCFIRYNIGGNMWMFKVIGYSETGYLGYTNNWGVLKVSHVISIDPPKKEGYSQIHKIIYKKGLIAKFKTGETSIGQIISHYAQDSQYGKAPDSIIEFGRNFCEFDENGMAKIPTLEDVNKEMSKYLMNLKEVPLEVYDAALNVVLANQLETVKFVDKYNKYL